MKDNLETLNVLADSRVKLTFEKDEINTKLKEVNQAIKLLDKKISDILESQELQKFSHPRGTFSLSKKESVKLPSNSDNWNKFFNWLKKEEIYEDYRTINAQSLNSLFKQYKANLMLQAKTSGSAEDLAKALEFLPPGLEEPTVYTELSLRGKKKE